MKDQAHLPQGGESIVWHIMGTLIAGPVLYGLIGFGVDNLADVSFGLPIGIVVGFVLSGYIIYTRYGREAAPGLDPNGEDPERAHDDDHPRR
ncbi:hypothetical protein G1H11_22735 [Phytoactinopolyspora alkaliphila]|uniref:AtpZ/AtpI family protein n=1 Tax=Phytoactinopolyspora alkaliphila TaxID=1783498 RepID=A0A6N9YT49_9ACTN|nr:hypothetical protein [Phytoactinopolyspora alkaliphila]NED98120.1 hypothetical protein [Phytoactinopolyspora alkaliphila]